MKTHIGKRHQPMSVADLQALLFSRFYNARKITVSSNCKPVAEIWTEEQTASRSDLSTNARSKFWLQRNGARVARRQPETLRLAADLFTIVAGVCAAGCRRQGIHGVGPPHDRGSSVPPQSARSQSFPRRSGATVPSKSPQALIASCPLLRAGDMIWSARRCAPRTFFGKI